MPAALEGGELRRLEEDLFDEVPLAEDVMPRRRPRIGQSFQATVPELQADGQAQFPSRAAYNAATLAAGEETVDEVGESDVHGTLPLVSRRHGDTDERSGSGSGDAPGKEAKEASPVDTDHDLDTDSLGPLGGTSWGTAEGTQPSGSAESAGLDVPSLRLEGVRSAGLVPLASLRERGIEVSGAFPGEEPDVPQSSDPEG